MLGQLRAFAGELQRIAVADPLNNGLRFGDRTAH
jgi:hypothetical protein